MSNVQESLLQAAIPGQSLTDEPKNFPWERAAEYSDPTEAARYELKKLNKPEVLDSVLALLQTGFPIIPLAETIKTNSQAEGLYNPDVGLLITPVIVEQLVSTANDAGMDYVMGDEEDEEELTRQEEERVEALLKKDIVKLLTKNPDDDLIEDALGSLEEIEQESPMLKLTLNEEEEKKEEPVEMTENITEEVKPMGLMNRSTM